MSLKDSTELAEEKLLLGFEAGTFPASRFHHREHVQVVWLYLHKYSLLEVLNKFSAALRQFAAVNGKPNLYHETITWAYVLLINERMQRSPSDRTWPEFVDENPDLFDWHQSILRAYYCADTLKSDLARRSFVLPDRFVKTNAEACSANHQP